MAIVLLAGVTFAVAARDTPFSLQDLRLIALHSVIVGTAAIGMTLIIISGGIDLSVGSAVALAGVVAAIALKDGWPPWIAVFAAIATGALCGLYNGLLVNAMRLPAFIATLGTLGFYRGLAKWFSGSSPVNARPAGLDELVRAAPEPAWLLVAPGFWLMLLLAAAAGVVLHRTVFGRHAVAIGSNEEAAARCAIPVRRVSTLVFVFGGLFAGFAGLLQFARIKQGDPTAADGLELDVIAAVVIGGASLSGGQGSIVGTLAGAVLMALLRNRCTALGWPNLVQEMIVGHIIIAAVAIDRWTGRRGQP